MRRYGVMPFRAAVVPAEEAPETAKEKTTWHVDMQ